MNWIYISLYTKDQKHITNITQVEYSLTKRVYDMDTFSAKGSANTLIDKNQVFIYVLYNEGEEVMHSGFVKSFKQGKNLRIDFKGEDFRTIFDTQIFLDYSNIPAETQNQLFELRKVIGKVCDQVLDSWGSAINETPINIIPITDRVQTTLAGNFIGQTMIVEASRFLKTYLAYEWKGAPWSSYSRNYVVGDIVYYAPQKANYKCILNHTSGVGGDTPGDTKTYWMKIRYGLMLKSYYNTQTNEITFEFTFPNSNNKPFKTEDFEYELSSKEVKINKTIALIKFDTLVEGGVTKWVSSSENYWYEQLFSNRVIVDYVYEPIPTPLPPVEDYSVGFALKWIEWNDFIGGTIRGITYWQITPEYRARPDTLAHKEYYLGLDNEIYENQIDDENQILPVKQKIFEDEFLYQSQFSAISELVNNRYVDDLKVQYIENKTPYSMNEMVLNDRFDIYDYKGFYKELPLSEIETSSKNGILQHRIKFGFKRTFFTEVFKNERN